MLIAVWLIGAIVVGIIAACNGRNFFGWMVLSMLVSPIMGFVCLMVDLNKTKTERKCPACAESVKAEASVCRHCHSALPPIQKTPVRTGSDSEHAWVVGVLVVIAVFVLVWASKDSRDRSYSSTHSTSVYPKTLDPARLVMPPPAVPWQPEPIMPPLSHPYVPSTTASVSVPPAPVPARKPARIPAVRETNPQFEAVLRQVRNFGSAATPVRQPVAEPVREMDPTEAYLARLRKENKEFWDRQNNKTN